MTFEIISDIDHKYFEVSTKNKRFSGYPGAAYNRFDGYTVRISKNRWYEDLEDIAVWVNDELKESCEFTIG